MRNQSGIVSYERKVGFMGAWGTSLYANDAACDIRGAYEDKLRRSQTNEEATEGLIRINQDIMGDIEEEPLFWYALADTQWNYGRLLPFVKEKALEFIDCSEELERWKDSGEKKVLEWENTRKKLKEKLCSPQPPEKKVSKYRLYKCKWALGDVFAYRFHGEYSKQMGVCGKYIIFRKVEEDCWWPGHIVPSVHIYMWMGDEIPTLEDVKKLPLLPQKWLPEVYVRNPEKEKEYLLNLQASREKSIPQEYLTYIGNIPGDDLVAYRGDKYYCGYARTEWKNFEEKVLKQYYLWIGVH